MPRDSCRAQEYDQTIWTQTVNQERNKEKKWLFKCCDPCMRTVLFLSFRLLVIFHNLALCTAPKPCVTKPHTNVIKLCRWNDLWRGPTCQNEMSNRTDLYTSSRFKMRSLLNSKSAYLRLNAVNMRFLSLGWYDQLIPVWIQERTWG